MALPVRGGPDQYLHRPGRKEADRGRIPAAGAVANRTENARGREAAHLEIGREADAELFGVASFPPLSLLTPNVVVVEDLECGIEVCVVVAGVDGEPGDDRRRELAQEVQPTDLDRILPDRARERVDCTLDRVGRLGSSCTTIRIGRRRVGEDTGALEVVRGEVVCAAVEPGAEQRRARGDELEVRSEVHRQLGPN